MSRPVQEVKARCSSALEDQKLVAIVEGSSSPSAAYDLVFQATGDASKAKAGRWLAVLKRDHPAEYKKVLQGGRS